MTDYEKKKQAYANGTLKLRTDEYIGENGLPYCSKCHTPKWCIVGDNNEYACPISCECKAAAEKQEREAEKRRKRFAEFNERRQLSFLGERYKNIMFDNAQITDNNRSVYKSCRNYVKQAKEVFDNNVGLYIYGGTSSGKTFLTACICNELLWLGYKCVYTNLATMLGEIMNKGNSMGENELIRRLQYYDFAFIDDLGKEFMGRETNASAAKWAESKLFEIINARYNTKKPTIFTSNYAIDELDDKLNLDAAIIDRIVSISTVVLKLDGDNFRRDERNDTREIAKRLGIL